MATPDFPTTAAPSDRYLRIYGRLGELRERFHSRGGLDDSNAKLDEIVKLLATYLAYRRGQIPDFPLPERRAGHLARATALIGRLEQAFRKAARLSCYQHEDGSSIFGKDPRMGLHRADAALAALLVDTIVEAVDEAFTAQSRGESFDVLNEAFGHFVRDNFRSNIEDAQYLTPPEVVEFIVGVAMEELPAGRRSGAAVRVLDPCCGVGSFLAAFSHQYRESGFAQQRPLELFGQDKVERMVRLTKVNLALFDAAHHSVTIGNSLLQGSALDALQGSVDFILTNPPFGARFPGSEVLAAGADAFPLLAPIGVSDAQIDSELLFIDRSLSLLRPDGHLLIVVPDGVVSAKGLAAALRSRMAGIARLRMIVELPPVTFAQAGTRTRTVVLHLQKQGPGAHARRSVFIGRARELGFEVTSRKGVQVKITRGGNDLPQLLAALREAAPQAPAQAHRVATLAPSAVFVSEELIRREGWTPSRLSAERFAAIDGVAAMRDALPTPLRALARLESDSRRAVRATAEHAYISVLHVIGDGVLDVAGAMSYVPKTPGIPVNPGEILLSRINPRIPRVLVVPDLGRPMLCSSEFEILTPTAGLDAFELAYLLLSPPVTQQISNLTSGTSASHNRIRSDDLAAVVLPVPSAGGLAGRKLRAIMDEYRRHCRSLSDALIKIHALRHHDATLNRIEPPRWRHKAKAVQ